MDGRLHDILRKQTQRADETAKRAIEDGAKSLKPGSLLNRARKRTGEKVAKGFRAEADAAYADVKKELDRIADAAADETARKIEALTGKPAKAARGAVDGRQLRADLRRSNASRAKNAERALGRAVKGTPPGKRDAAASEAAKSAWKDVAKSRQRKRFVDSRGRAWKDSVYNEMRAKTMEANAKRAAQIATLRANGFKLARISDGVQENTCEDCHLWRGAIVSLTGRAYRGYPALEKVVATTKLFHPNCIHYIEPYWEEEEDGSRANLSMFQIGDAKSLASEIKRVNVEAVAARDRKWCSEEPGRIAVKKKAAALLPNEMRQYAKAFDALPTRAIQMILDANPTVIPKDRPGSYEEDGTVYLSRVDVRESDGTTILHELSHAVMTAKRDQDGDEYWEKNLPAGTDELLKSLKESVESAMEDLFGKNWRLKNGVRLFGMMGGSARNYLSSRVLGIKFDDLPNEMKQDVGTFCDMLQNATKGWFGYGHTVDYFSDDYHRMQELVAEASEMAPYPVVGETSFVMKYLRKPLELAFKMNFGIDYPL